MVKKQEIKDNVSQEVKDKVNLLNEYDYTIEDIHTICNILIEIQEDNTAKKLINAINYRVDHIEHLVNDIVSMKTKKANK